MKLKRVYDSMDDVPEGYADLYEEQDGKAVFVGLVGLPDQSNIDRLETAVRKEREDHKETKDKLKKFERLGDLEDITDKIDRIEELEAAAEGKLDEDKISELADKRVKTATAPLNRRIQELEENNETLQASNDKFERNEKQRTVKDAFSPIIRDQKIVPEAVEDVNLYAERLFEVNDAGEVVTRDGVGETPGLTPEQWLTDQQEKRRHWWPASEGAGATGSGGGGGLSENPWSAAHWNLTKQGAYIKEHGMEKAKRAAAAAGVAVDAIEPKAAK